MCVCARVTVTVDPLCFYDRQERHRKSSLAIIYPSGVRFHRWDWTVNAEPTQRYETRCRKRFDENGMKSFPFFTRLFEFKLIFFSLAPHLVEKRQWNTGNHFTTAMDPSSSESKTPKIEKFESFERRTIRNQLVTTNCRWRFVTLALGGGTRQKGLSKQMKNGDGKVLTCSYATPFSIRKRP